MTITPQQLATKIRKLNETLPITAEFERTLARRGLWNNDDVWYTSQKRHWIGWLREYGGPGYYGRKNSQRSAQFVYNHIVCPPMVLWLAEASGVPKARIAKAKQAALSSGPQLQCQSAAIRKMIPWEMIEIFLTRRSN
jgi:hypothetical protein